MKRTGRNILILLVILAVLGGGTFLLMQMPAGTDQEENSESSVSDTVELAALFDKEDTDIQSVSVKNTEDEFQMVPTQTSTGLGFTIEGYEEYDLNSSQVSANVRTLLGFTPSKDLGGRDDLEAFGLGKEGSTLTLQYKDGESDTLVLGNTAAESNGRYALKDGNVYIIAGVPDYFYRSKFAYFNTSIYVIPDRVDVTIDEEGESSEQEAQDRLDSMTLSGTHFPEQISIKPSSKYLSGYGLTEPVTVETGNTAFNELMTSLKTLTANSVVDAGITEEKLEQYGLSEPDAKISFELNETEHEITVSAKDSEGNRYMLADGKDVIYQIANSSVEKWAECSVMDLRMSYIWIANIKDVNKLSITLGDGKVRSFDITREKNEEKSTESSIEYDITSITAEDGSSIEYEVYQPFYQKLIGLAVFMPDKVDYSGTPDFKVEYQYVGGGSNTVEFYEIPGKNRYAAVLDGQYNGQIRGTDFSEMLDLMP